MPGHHGSARGNTAGRGALLQEARVELEQAARDLEDLTDVLHARTRLVEQLEVLVDALLDLLDTPAVVVDAEGRIAAMSRGTARAYPALGDGVGRLAAGLLPAAALEAIDRAESPPVTGADGHDSRVRALPDGAVLVLLGPGEA